MLPRIAATCSGVRASSLVLTLTFALRSIRNDTTAAWSLAHALWRAVSPFCFKQTAQDVVSEEEEEMHRLRVCVPGHPR